MRKSNSFCLSKGCQEVIYGSILGDGSINKTKDMTNYRFGITHHCKFEDYMRWKGNLINIPLKIRKCKDVEHLKLQTLSCVELTYLRNEFYDGKQKHLPENIPIEKVLTPLSLAVWYMDDGSFPKKKECLFTSEFLLDRDAQAIQDLLEVHYKIKTTLWSNNRIRICKKSEMDFFRIIAPYVTQIPSMLYKISVQ